MGTPLTSAILTALAFCLVPSAVSARKAGILSSGCDGCHRDGSEPAVSIMTEPASFGPGDTISVIVSIAATNGDVGGFYLLADGGRFVPQAGQSTLLVTDTEVTHGAPKRAAGDAVSFRTSWTAPAVAGGVYFRTWALSADGDGSARGDGGGQAALSLAFGCSGQSYTLDFDGDGWAEAGALALLSCAPPPGFASAVGDCNDLDPSIYPGAPEICNRRDDSCDGQTDEGLTSGLVTLYEDTDGDGHGAYFGAMQTVMGCIVPAGFSPVADDCDDADRAVSPDAVETCNLLDDDCDEEADEELRPECGVGMCLRRSSTCDPADCVPGPAKPEICNYADDDCDGDFDEDGALCGAGQVCYFGRCLNSADVPATDEMAVDGGEGTSSSTPRASERGGCAIGRSRQPSVIWLSLAIAVVLLTRRRTLCLLVPMVLLAAGACGGQVPRTADPAGERQGSPLALGAGHTCAVGQDGATYCWGSNPDGQLGNGTETISQAEPGVVAGLEKVRSLAAGSYHTCALLEDGGVACWGWNVAGQIGDGSTHNRLTAFRIGSLDGSISVAAGSYHSCALHEDGSARCWGQNDAGQLGNGSLENFVAPTAVFSLPEARKLAAGGRHSCALIRDGTVQCWGGNDYGELGDGTTERHVFPEPVSGVTEAVGIAAGFNHSCALLANGTVLCWGSNQYGQIGDGATTDRVVPTPVVGLSAATSIAAGYNHSCALIAGGEARCWGWNDAGQLGSANTEFTPSPVRVQDLSSATSLAGGGFHTCAVAHGATIFCWGSNDSGQLGPIGTPFESSPREIRLSTL